MTPDQLRLGMPVSPAWSHDPLPKSEFAVDDLHDRLQFETWVDATPEISLIWMIQSIKWFPLVDGSTLFFISEFGDEIRFILFQGSTACDCVMGRSSIAIPVVAPPTASSPGSRTRGSCHWTVSFLRTKRRINGFSITKRNFCLIKTRPKTRKPF